MSWDVHYLDWVSTMMVKYEGSGGGGGVGEDFLSGEKEVKRRMKQPKEIKNRVEIGSKVWGRGLSHDHLFSSTITLHMFSKY